MYLISNEGTIMWTSILPVYVGITSEAQPLNSIVKQISLAWDSQYYF